LPAKAPVSCAKVNPLGGTEGARRNGNAMTMTDAKYDPDAPRASKVHDGHRVLAIVPKVWYCVDCNAQFDGDTGSAWEFSE